MANLSNINNKFLVTTGGEVLVGRTAATGTSKLQVSGSLLIGTDINSGIPLVVQETTADGFAIGFMRNTNATNGNGLVIDVNSTGGAYIQDWRQASTVKMRLLQNGNLGIGTDSPNANLDILNGTTGASLKLSATSTAYWQLQRDSVTGNLNISDDALGNVMSFDQLTGNVGIGVTPFVSNLPNTVIDINPVASIWGYANSVYLNSNAYYNNGWLYKSTAAAGVLQVDGDVLRFRAAASGTANAGVAFDVPFIVDSGGNVGIGVTSPNYKLSVANASTRIISATYIDGTNGIMSHAGAPNYGLESFQVRGDSISFWTDYDASHYQGTEKMRITTAGNIQFAQDGYINTNTADASDNLSLQLSGGGAFGDTRGACIALAGNENGNGGLIQLRAGQGQYSEVRTYTSGAERTRVEDNGDFILYGGRLYLNSGTGYNNTGYIYLSNGRTAIESNIVNLTANGDTSLNFKTRSGGANSSAMYIDEFRNVGIGTDSPGQKLEVAGNIRIDSRSKLGSGEVDNITFTKNRPDAATGTYEMGAIRSFTTNGYSGGMTFYCGRHTGGGGYALIPTMTIGHTIEIGLAYVGIGTTTPTGNLTVEASGNQLHLRASTATAGKFWNFDIASSNRLYIIDNGNTGVYINDGATSWTGVSDETLKENVKPLENVLDKIKDYRCVEYNLKSVPNDKKIGFIAQDWQEDYPQIVDKDDDGLLGMKYTETIPVLLKAIQELKAEIELLKSK